MRNWQDKTWSACDTQGEVHAALFLDSKFILPAKVAAASFQLLVQLLDAQGFENF